MPLGGRQPYGGSQLALSHEGWYREFSTKTFSPAEHVKKLVAGKSGYISELLSTCLNRSHPAGAWHFGKKLVLMPLGRTL